MNAFFPSAVKIQFKRYRAQMKQLKQKGLLKGIISRDANALEVGLPGEPRFLLSSYIFWDRFLGGMNGAPRHGLRIFRWGEGAGQGSGSRKSELQLSEKRKIN